MELFGVGFRELGKRCGKHPADAWDTRATPDFPEYSVALVYRRAMGMDITTKGEDEFDRIDAAREAQRRTEQFVEEEWGRVEAYLAKHAEEDEPDDGAGEKDEAPPAPAPAATLEYTPGRGPMDVNRKPPPKTNQRGGKREGSGRKPREKAPARHVRAVRLTEAEDVRYSKWMRSGESWGAYLRRVLDGHARVQERVQQMREQRERGAATGDEDGGGGEEG